MAAANSNIQITDLDFDTIKQNLRTFLQGQDTFKDYNFEGSGLSHLLDVLAYNTQYNAYYLNMIANEMFLDTATQRSSVVSHAKLLNYTPMSAIAPSATVNINVDGAGGSSLTLPAYTNFVSEPIDGINYNFLTIDSNTTNVANNIAQFDNIEIKQGVHGTVSYTVGTQKTYEIPDATVDTSTLKVVVTESSTNTSTQVYSLATDYLYLDGSSTVYFLQETLNNTYEIYFGDGVVGKSLKQGNIVTIDYISTEGLAAAGANSFVIMDSIGTGLSVTVESVSEATAGRQKETIDSIKYQAPKSFSSMGRAVTSDDYITAIQQNNLGITFDAVNVWGGQENNPPVYGQVFISLKPQGAYNLTLTQKQRLVNEVLKPISVLTVEPTIVEPDYTYIKIVTDVVYDPKKTTLTSSQIQSVVANAVNQFATSSLNTFNSTFSISDLLIAIKNSNSAIISNDCKIQLQKKFFPNLSTPQTYKLYYGTELQKGQFLSGINSSPALQFRDPTNLATIIDGIYIEEVPAVTNGVETIQVINPGYGYQTAPSVQILGDGSGATAHAIITTSGSIQEIVVDEPGTGYTSAIVQITPASGDTTGNLGAAVAILEGATGTLRTYYNNTLSVKSVFDSDVGSVNYADGLITLNSFGPIQVDNPLGQLTITATPASSVFSSTYNRILTVDPFDSNAITVNVTAKA